MELEDVFYLLANGLAISVIGIILIVVLPPSPVQAQTTLNSYTTGIIQECSLLNKDITCLTGAIDELKQDFDRIYEERGTTLNIAIINEENGEVEYFSDSDADEPRRNSMINSCNLFESCITKYYSYENDKYKIIIL